MITSYSELKTSIAAFLHRTDLTAMIPEFIADGETKIYNDLRIKAMETAYTATISSGVVALPTGFLEWKNLYVDTSPIQKLDRKSAEWIYQYYPNRTAQGTPKFFAQDGSNLIFAPYPNSNFEIKGVYYKRLDALSDSNTSNWFILNAPEILRYAALCEAAPYCRDLPAVQVWEQKYEAIKQRLKSTERREAFSGSVLTMTAG
jgi:hypothetical protein